jgi:hypothetical protein
LAAAASWLTTAYYAVMLALVIVPFLAVWVGQRGLRVGRRFWGGMAVAGVVGFLVVAPTLPPYVRLQRAGLFDRSPHGVSGVAWSELWRLPPSLWYRLVAGVHPFVRYDKSGLFPGLVLTVLVAVAVVGALADRVRHRPPGPRRGAARWVWPLAAGCVLCLAVMVGPGQPGGLSAGYVGLRAAVPGVASLRDLGRFWVWPLLCLALLAGVGADRLLARFRGRSQVVLAVGLLAVVWAELLFRPQVANVDFSPRATAVNHVLAHLPAGPVMELPEPLGPVFPYVTAGRQLRSLIDHHPRVDGYSGNVPPATDTIDRLATQIGPAELVPIMRRYGVRYVVLHGTAQPCAAGYSAAELTFILHSLGTVSGVERIVPLGDDRIVLLAPAPIDRSLPVVGPGAARPSRCT